MDLVKLPEQFKMRFLNENHVLIVLIILFENNCSFVNKQLIDPNWRFDIPRAGIIKDNFTLYGCYAFSKYSSFNQSLFEQINSYDFIEKFDKTLFNFSIEDLLLKIEEINSKS